MTRLRQLMGFAALVMMAGLATPGAHAEDKADTVYSRYARWWKEQNASRKDWVLRDAEGKRKYKAFYRPLNPPHVTAALAEKKGMVQDPTFVLGVAVGREARAYPLYSIGELVNDTLGEAPIAASW